MKRDIYPGDLYVGSGDSTGADALQVFLFADDVECRFTEIVVMSHNIITSGLLQYEDHEVIFTTEKE